MTRLLCFTTVCALAVSPVSADEYWVAYEGNDFPENEGWTRTFSDKNGVFGQGGAIRTFENGALVLDSLRSILIVDFYDMSRPLDPDPGELFTMRWRLKIDSVPGEVDPGMGVFSDGVKAVAFQFHESSLQSTFEPNVSVPFEPYVFHVFELTSSDMDQYHLSIDGIPALDGRFEAVAEASRVFWGDVIQGGTSVTRWDYFEFGVVPEPSALLCMLCGSLAVFAIRRKTNSPRSKS